MKLEGQPKLESIGLLRSRRRHWLSHVTRLSDNRIPKQVHRCQVEGFRRGPWQTWRSTVWGTKLAGKTWQRQLRTVTDSGPLLCGCERSKWWSFS